MSTSRSIEAGADGSVVKQDSTFLFILLLVAAETVRKIRVDLVNKTDRKETALVAAKKDVKEDRIRKSATKPSSAEQTNLARPILVTFRG